MQQTESNSLQRHITGFGLYIFIVGDTLGAGIYALVGIMIERSGGAVWIPLLCALCVALLTATSYGELVSKYPSAAGVSGFVQRAFKNDWLTFIIGFILVCSTISCAASLISAFSGRYLQEIVVLEHHVVIPAVLVLIAFFTITCIDYLEKANFVMLSIKVLGLSIIVALAIVVLCKGEGNPEQLMSWRTDDAPISVLLSSTAVAIFAFMGFEGSASMADEIQDVRRNYPWALVAGLLSVGLMYIVFASCVTSVLPVDTVGNSDGPLLEILSMSKTTLSSSLFSFIALIAVLNAATLSIIMASRMIFGLSQQGRLPAIIAQKVNRHGSPWLALVITCAVVYVMCLTADLKIIVETVVILVLLVFIIVNFCCILMREEKVAEQVFFAKPWMAPCAIAGSLLLLFQQQGQTFARAGIMIAIGCFINLAMVKFSQNKNGIEVELSG
ncbi:MAG: APC family permease [Micrococcaceae bacterium]